MTSNLVSLFSPNASVIIPDYLRAPKAPSALAGGLGDSRNRIGLGGCRFRLIESGQEVAVRLSTHLDVIVVAANAAVSRIFYATKFVAGSKTAPDCFSATGAHPSPTATSPQDGGKGCAQCPQNVKGSRMNDDGSKGRACSFAKRLVVTLPGGSPLKAYQLDVKAMSIFGTGVAAQGLFSLSEYAKLLAGQGVRAEGVVTRLTFDTAQTVPKLFFTPMQWLDQPTMVQVQKLAETPEVRAMIDVTLDTLDLPEEIGTAPMNTVPAAGVVAPNAPVVPINAVPPVYPPVPEATVVPAAPAAPPGFRFDVATNSYVAVPVAPVAPAAPVATAAAAATTAVTAAQPNSDDELKKMLAGLGV